MFSHRYYLALGILLVSSTALAEDYPHRLELGHRSLSSGLGVPVVSLLALNPGPGAQAVSDRMIQRYAQSTGAITTAGNVDVTLDASDVLAQGAGWELSVFGDGSAMRYRNYGYHDAHFAPIDFAQRPSLQMLEDWGRRFFVNELSQEIALLPNEQLHALTALYDTISYQPVDLSAPAVDAVIGSVVVFTRAIDGVDLVGPGSKIAVLFENDGTPYGFDFDWAGYSSAGAQQLVLPVSEINRRDGQLSDRQFNPGTPIETQLFECGYFDAGYAHRDPQAVLQSGCAYHRSAGMIGDPALYAADPSDGLFVTAFADVVPAGESIQLDTRWGQAYFAVTGTRLQAIDQDPGVQ